MTTEVPLAYISSPWISNEDQNSNVDETGIDNAWQRNSMLLLESLFLMLEDASPWIGEPAFSLPQTLNLESMEVSFDDLSDMQDCANVRDILEDPESYSESTTMRLFEDGRATALSLEVVIILLTHQQTCDALLYLLYIRLPNRHEILTRVMGM